MLPTPDTRITLQPPLDGVYGVRPYFEGAELRLALGADQHYRLDPVDGGARKLRGSFAQRSPRSPWRPAHDEKKKRAPLRFTHAETGETRELEPLGWHGAANVIDVVGDLLLWCDGYSGHFELRAVSADRVEMTATVPGAGPNELAVSGDARVIAASGDGLLWLFCADVWDDPWRLRLPDIRDAIPSLDAAGERLALLHHEVLTVHRVAALREEPRPTPLGLGGWSTDHVALSRDGSRLVASVNGGGVAVADLDRGAVARHSHEEQLSHLALAPDGRACAWASLTEATQQLDLPERIEAGTELAAPHPLPAEPTAATMAFHPDGEHIALVVGHFDLAQIELRRRDGAVVATFPSEGLPLRVEISPDGRYLCWSETSGALHTWDLAAVGVPQQVFDGTTPTGRGITGAARELFIDAAATWVGEGSGRVHRAAHGGEIELDWLPWDEDPNLIRPIALSPNGRLLAWAVDEVATVIDTETREALTRVPVVGFGVSLFLPGDGHLVVVEHREGGLVWRVAHPALVDPPPAVTPLALPGGAWEAPKARDGVPSELDGEAIGWFRHVSAALATSDSAERLVAEGYLTPLARVLAAYASLRRQEGLRRAVELAHEAGIIDDGPDKSRLPAVVRAAPPRDPARALERVSEAEAALWDEDEERIARCFPGDTAELIEAACGRVGEQLRFDAAFRGFEAAGGAWTSARLARAIAAAESGEEVLAALVFGLSALGADADPAPLAAIAGDAGRHPAEVVAALTALRGLRDRSAYRAALTAHERADRLERMVDFLIEWAWQLASGLGVA